MKQSKTIVKMNQMKKNFKQISKQNKDLNKKFLTTADGSFYLLKSNLDDGEVLLSWRFKRRDLISDPTFQMKDDCWAHAFARALSALMKQHGSTENLPTAALLVAQIDKKFLTKTKGLPKSIDAATSVLHNYGCSLVVHHRPKLKLLEDNEEFEKFIERRLAIGPVAVCFLYVPGYSCFSHKNKAVFRPSVIDIQAMHYESLDNHCAVITGRGVVLIGGKSIEFWEIHETRGDHFGDKGFTRLERHKGLIIEL
ncbi:unnamed protein product, partial [Thlaspi arvense]